MPKVAVAELEIHYVDEGQGEVLLILPENPHSSLAYRAEIDHFAEHYRVLSFDPPGTGRSTRDNRYEDEQELDLWNYWADLACHLLLDLDVVNCYVLGAGYGAWTALHFAGRQAGLHGLEARAVLADSFLADVDGRTLHRALDGREHYYTRRVDWLRQQHGDDWRQVVDADTRRLRLLADRGGYAVPGGVLGAIRCPVLLSGSLKDTATPGIASEYARIAGLVPDCSLYLAAGSGHRYGDEHPLLWTAPDLFRAAADLFLARA